MVAGQQVWLVTGANGGFGRALVEQSAARGHIVVAAARDAERLADVVERFPESVVAVECDVADHLRVLEVVEDVLARFERIDVLINNAGHTHVGAAEETTDSELAALMNVHFHGAAAVTRAVLPAMRARRHGVVAQISSVCGRVAMAGFAGYGAAKERPRSVVRVDGCRGCSVGYPSAHRRTGVVPDRHPVRAVSWRVEALE